jgi:hypothetical protein
MAALPLERQVQVPLVNICHRQFMVIMLQKMPAVMIAIPDLQPVAAEVWHIWVPLMTAIAQPVMVLWRMLPQPLNRVTGHLGQMNLSVSNVMKLQSEWKQELTFSVIQPAMGIYIVPHAMEVLMQCIPHAKPGIIISLINTRAAQ